MDKERYEAIIDALDERLKACSEKLGKCATEEGLDSLTVGEIRGIRDFCRDELKRQSLMITTDLYHLIGADMTPPQSMRFLKKTKEYLGYRTRLKVLSSPDASIDAIHDVNSKRHYDCLTFGGVRLDYGGAHERPASEKQAQPAPKAEGSADEGASRCFELKGDVVYVKKENARMFWQHAVSAGVLSGLFDAWMKKSLLGRPYCGIYWLQDSESIIGKRITKQVWGHFVDSI